jgi:OOP family OmpA-OmpF porin
MKKSVFLCALMLASGVAFGQQTGFYVGGSVGQASGNDIDADKELAAEFRDMGLTDVSSGQDDTDTAYKLFAGYQINNYFAVEGGYVNFGKFTVDALGNLAGSAVNASGDVKSYAVFVDLVGTFPVNETFSVFGKAGGAYARTKADVSVNVGGLFASDSESERDFVPKIGVGAQFNLGKNFALRAEYEKYFNVGDSGSTGESDVDMWSIGAVFKF